MAIEIRKRVYNEASYRFYKGIYSVISKKYHIYVVVQDNKRIDSFLYYRNAQAKVRALKKQL